MAGYNHVLTMPWAYSAESDDRFQHILRINLLLCLLFGAVVPMLPLPEATTSVIDEPPRLATLILEQKPVPPPPKPKPVPQSLPKKITQPEPAPVPEKAVAPKKTETPAKPMPKVARPTAVKPVPVKPKITARQQAEQTGLLALKDNLADMRQTGNTSNLRNTGQLSQGGGQARSTERAILTAGTTRTSGGIKTSNLSRNTGGGELASRTTTQVHNPAVDAAGGRVGNSDRGMRTAGRSIEEIQMVFDRNKGAIYSVYNRALRQDPTLQGKVVLQLTIAPSGKVTHCELISSELHDAALGRKIAQRVQLFNFEAKDVSEVTITYPIDFLPA
jgi:TonB family protein